MATRRQKTSCTTCGTMVGVFSCRGCSKNFCIRHTTDHREVLQKSMNEILHQHEQLRRDMKGQTVEQYEQILMKQVDEWERESMEKIRHLAEHTRQELVTTVRYRSDDLKEKLEELKQQLDEARHDGGFYENDLREWSERLNDLQRIFVDQQTLKIEEDNISTTAFISRISFNDSFRKDYRYSRQYVDEHALVQDSQEYIQGKNFLRIKIEQFQPTSSVRLGIISKIDLNHPNPDQYPTFYGWAEKNLVYLGNVQQVNHNGYESDFQSNDIFLLTIDCEGEKLSLTNERTNRSYDLHVDLRQCPFPWLLNARLYNDDAE